jgi:hypothetical protein
MEKLAQLLIAARQAGIAHDPATGLLAEFISTGLGKYAREAGIDPELWQEQDAEKGGLVVPLLNRAQKGRRLETRRRYHRADRAAHAEARDAVRAMIRKFREEHPGEDMAEIVSIMIEAGHPQPEWWDAWQKAEEQAKSPSGEDAPPESPKRSGKR